MKFFETADWGNQLDYDHAIQGTRIKLFIICFVTRAPKYFEVRKIRPGALSQRNVIEPRWQNYQSSGCIQNRLKSLNEVRRSTGATKSEPISKRMLAGGHDGCTTSRWTRFCSHWALAYWSATSSMQQEIHIWRSRVADCGQNPYVRVWVSK